MMLQLQFCCFLSTHTEPHILSLFSLSLTDTHNTNIHARCGRNQQHPQQTPPPALHPTMLRFLATAPARMASCSLPSLAAATAQRAARAPAPLAAASAPARGFKTNKAAKKRFLKTGSGKIKRWKTGHRHLNSGKGRKVIRDLGGSVYLKGFQVKRFKKMVR